MWARSDDWLIRLRVSKRLLQAWDINYCKQLSKEKKARRQLEAVRQKKPRGPHTHLTHREYI